MWLIFVILLLATAALLTIGTLAWREVLPRNRWAGIRTRTTMSSDSVWLAAHRQAGPWLTGAGALMAPATFLTPFAKDSRAFAIAAIVLVAVSMALLVGGAISATDAARKALERQISGEREI